VDVLHDEEVRAVDESDLVDLRDIGMFERRHQASLVKEPLHGVAIGELWARAFDDDDLLEALHAGLSSQPDLGHSARREVTEQRVLAELLGEDGVHRVTRFDHAHVNYEFYQTSQRL